MDAQYIVYCYSSKHFPLCATLDQALNTKLKELDRATNLLVAITMVTCFFPFFTHTARGLVALWLPYSGKFMGANPW